MLIENRAAYMSLVEQQRGAINEQRERSTNDTTTEPIQQPITLPELHVDLNKLKSRKSPGPYLITNEMLTHLDSKATNKLLEVFNHSWKMVSCRQI